MRSMQGALTFFDISAGMAMLWLPGILLPKAPPVYSLMSTTSSTVTPTMRAMFGTVCATLCVEP